MQEWYWNNNETIVYMNATEYGKKVMVKCSNELKKLLDKESMEVWEKENKS